VRGIRRFDVRAARVLRLPRGRRRVRWRRFDRDVHPASGSRLSRDLLARMRVRRDDVQQRLLRECVGHGRRLHGWVLAAPGPL